MNEYILIHLIEISIQSDMRIFFLIKYDEHGSDVDHEGHGETQNEPHRVGVEPDVHRAGSDCVTADEEGEENLDRDHGDGQHGDLRLGNAGIDQL